MYSAKIRDLPENPAGVAVYRRRATDHIYLRLNERFHVKVRAGKKKGQWIGDGKAEEINLEEEVDVIVPEQVADKDVTLLTPMYGMVRIEIEGVGSLSTKMEGEPLVMGAVQVMVFKSGEAMVLGNIEKDADRLFKLISFDGKTSTARIKKK